MRGTYAFGGVFIGEKDVSKKMVEESGIFRYNNSVGDGAAAVNKCDLDHFPESDLSSAHAISVGIISDPYAWFYGQICG